ncbi:type VI immunity family protein [Pseudomonas sp. MWU12-3103b]|uniref:type VI immunity family protein n=1 Tax=Pseudomonas sp. MWU12-3103b TaxID=2928857 RepID=UPI001FFF77FB|nr:type VI immunity family protein [Pseudomonas sp. MWU12-3103b]
MNTLEKLTERAPDLMFELPDGTPVVRLGLIVTLYFKEGYTLQSKQAVMQCFARFKEEFGQHLKGQFDDRYKKLTDASFDKKISKILETGPNEQYEWHISSAATANEAGEYNLSALNSFEVHGDQKRSFIKMTLPWNILQAPDGAARYRDWIVYLADKVKAEHGYGGLSSILPFDFDSYMPMEYQLAQQFTGLEVDSLVTNFKRELLDHIKGINWYTVVGNRFAEQLGGIDAINHSFSGRGDVEVLKYQYGLIVRAGELPDLGPINEPLPTAYIAVNRVFKPLRIPTPNQLHTYTPYGNCFEEDSTVRWYARFDQDDSFSKSPARLEAGQPCSVAGYWFTPAQKDSRRHFNQGEILPSFSGSSWGDTLWYWSGEE